MRCRPGIIPSGWRIYTVAASMPRFDPATWRLTNRRSRRPAADDRLRAAARSARGRAGLDLPLRDGLDGAATSTGAVCASPTCSQRPAPHPDADVLTLHLGREALRRHADARPGAPARRDARLRDGRQAAAAPARRAGAGRDPGHVRLQERQVGRADHASAPDAEPGYWEQRGYDTDAWVGRSNGF